MDTSIEERIRARAHAIWDGEGRPEGRHDEHWRRASEEIEADAGSGEAGDAVPTGGDLGTPGGLASGLQPGGTTPGGGPGTSAGSLGSGGGSTAGDATGTPARGVT